MSVKSDLLLYKVEIIDFCNKNQYITFEKNGAFYVISSTDKWIIADDKIGGTLSLYHKNTIMNRHSLKSYKSPFAKYHLQNCRKESIIDYLKYIKNHDEYIQKSNKPPSKKGKKYRKYKERNRKMQVSRILSILEDLDKIDRR